MSSKPTIFDTRPASEAATRYVSRRAPTWEALPLSDDLSNIRIFGMIHGKGESCVHLDKVVAALQHVAKDMVARHTGIIVTPLVDGRTMVTAVMTPAKGELTIEGLNEHFGKPYFCEEGHMPGEW